MNNTPTPTPEQPVPPALRARLDTTEASERHALEQTWVLAGLAQPDDTTPDLDALWQRVTVATNDLAASQAPAQQDRAPRRSSLRSTLRPAMHQRWVGALAATLLLGAIGLSWWLQPITATASFGERMTVELPDGSTAELNSGTTLSYQRPLLGWNRRVHLDGEGFFEVVHGEQTFVVETFNAAVTVLGISFNVRAWPNEPTAETRIVLATGVVQFAARTALDAPVQLAPGEMSWLPEVATAPHAPQAVPLDVVLAWRTGGFAFRDQTLGDILDEVARQYALELTASPSLQHHTLDLYLDPQPSAEAVLDVLCSFLDCTYEATATGYRVDAAR